MTPPSTTTLRARSAGLTAASLISLSLATGFGSASAADRIDTDGPDFVESTESVGPGRMQVETGPAIQRDTRGGQNLTTTTPFLFKAGLGGGVEARFETDGRVRNYGNDAAGNQVDQSGVADSAIGLKWHVRDRDPQTGAPALAWIMHFELPSGSREFHGEGVRPSLRAVIGWELPHEIGIGLMPGIKYDSRPDGHRYPSGILGLVAGKWWTEHLRLFVEASGQSIARQEDGGVIFYKDVGAAYLLGDNWQIGGRAGWAANNNTPGKYLQLSLAARF